MDRERDAMEEAYRAHLRQMTTARQAAERQRAMLRPSGAEERRIADAALRAEIAHLADEHRAWMRTHGLADNLPNVRHTPRPRRARPE